MRVTSPSNHPGPHHPPSWAHPHSQQASPAREGGLPHAGPGEACLSKGVRAQPTCPRHTHTSPEGRGTLPSCEGPGPAAPPSLVSGPGSDAWPERAVLSRGSASFGRGAGWGPCPCGPTAPGLRLAPGVLQHSRPSWGSPVDPGGLLQGRPIPPVPGVLGAGAPAPPELPLDLSSLPRDPGTPPAACNVCARTHRLPCPSVRPSPASVWLLSRCPCVCVSVSLCMWLVETPGRACGHRARRGASERRSEARPANARPLSPVIGAGVLRSNQAAC